LFRPSRRNFCGDRETMMPFSPEGYLARAEECVRLANMAKDAMIRRNLLELRQTYLKIAENLQRMRSAN
jgi:hypothetical protein